MINNLNYLNLVLSHVRRDHSSTQPFDGDRHTRARHWRAHALLLAVRGAREDDGVLRARVWRTPSRRLRSAGWRRLRFALGHHGRHIHVRSAVWTALGRGRGSADCQSNLASAHDRHWRGDSRGRAQSGLQWRHAARLRHPLGLAQVAALRRLRQNGVRRAHRRQRRYLRSLRGSHGGDETELAYYRAVLE